MQNFMKSNRLATVSVLQTITLILLSQGVTAQETVNKQTPKASSELNIPELETIQVTARRREESLLDVPLSVTAFLANQLNTGRTNSLEDLAEATPNVVFNPQAGPITIRGIGSLGTGAGLERQLGVGVFLDEVYIRRPNSFPVYLDDLERAEIVRGSQSTLYGENTIGGAINLISRKPSEELAGDLEMSAGSLGYQRVRAGIDAPLSDDVQTRTFVTYTKRDGHIKNEFTGVDEGTVDNIGIRFSVMGDMSEKTAYRLIWDYDKTDDDAGLPFVPVELALKGGSDNDYPAERQVDRKGATFRVEHELGNLDLLSTTAYRSYKYDALLDGDFSSGAYLFQGQDEKQSQFSQELRLSSDTENLLSWRLGLYYQHEDFEGSQFYDYLGYPLDQVSRNGLDQTSDVFALYGETTYQISDRLEASVGLRYTRETRDADAYITSPSGNFFLGAPAVVAADETFDDFLPELSLSYQAVPSTKLYARIARGFKAGGVSQFIDVNDTANVFEPEKTWSYEVGSKTSAFNHRLQFNFALFAIDWTDQQVRISITPTVRVVRNAAASSSHGAEAELAFQATENLKLNLGYGYLKAQYDEFAVDFLSLDFSGVEQQYAPKHNFSFGYDWGRELSANVTMFSSASYRYSADYRFEPGSDFRQPKTHIVDAEMGLDFGTFSLSIWGKNLTDEAFLKGYFDGGSIDYGVAAEGRTWGAAFRASF